MRGCRNLRCLKRLSCTQSLGNQQFSPAGSALACAILQSLPLPQAIKKLEGHRTKNAQTGNIRKLPGRIMISDLARILGFHPKNLSSLQGEKRKRCKSLKKNPMDFGPIEITCETATVSISHVATFFRMFSLRLAQTAEWRKKINSQTKCQTNYPPWN